MQDLINTGVYPITEPDSAAGRVLAQRCAEQLRNNSALLLPGFLSAGIVQELRTEVDALQAGAHRMRGAFSPYSDDLSEGGNRCLPENHPRRCKLPASHRFIAGDLIPPASPVRRLYQSPVFQTFAARVLGEERVCPVEVMAAVNYLLYAPGDCNGWHFDTTRYVISLALQLPDAGGEYEYLPELRSAQHENHAAVAWRMRHPDAPAGVRRAALTPGALFFFRGLHTLHRVKPVRGARDRIMAILSYHHQPGHITSDSSKRAMYGRTAPLAPAHRAGG